MPDLGNLLPSLQPCNPASPALAETLGGSSGGLSAKWRKGLRFSILDRGSSEVLRRERKVGKRVGGGKSLEEHVRDWAEKKVAGGAHERDCYLPFLSNAPKMVECHICSKCIYPGEEVTCSASACQVTYHKTCAKETIGLSKSKVFKCPQHACFICKQKFHWRCARCTMAAHSRCSPWPDAIQTLENQPGWAICWRHPSDWHLENKHSDPISDIKEVFCRLPLPYVHEEFDIGMIWKEVMDSQTKPAPYVHIKRNIYLLKKKRTDADDGVGCRNCGADSTCRDDCECRGLSISCSKACRCSDSCQNRPFRKEKKIKVVKTKFCGWGVEALENMEKGDFVVEYIGEVIDDALCEKRLWDMKHRGDTDFYMCEIQKDFTIDATFKGNTSRFINHSCNPNCELEKWQVDGETRVGVFASRSIKAGEPLTYDYRFVQFGRMVKCFCGAPNCQGFMGNKKKMNEMNTSWGSVTTASWGRKRRRSAAVPLSGY